MIAANIHALMISPRHTLTITNTINEAWCLKTMRIHNYRVLLLFVCTLVKMFLLSKTNIIIPAPITNPVFTIHVLPLKYIKTFYRTNH